jgi:peptide chain release factor subunit 1
VREASSEKCPVCGADMNYEEQDIIEELAELAESTSTQVEVISTETPEGEQFLNGFGGIGGILRYK